MKGKKSQMEILGLAFIFVIIIFGFLFFVNLNSETSTKDTLNEYLEPKIASGFTDMFLHTTVKCGEGYRTLRELFINCMSYDDSSTRDRCKMDPDLFIDLGNYDPTYSDPSNFEKKDSCEIVYGFLKLAENITLNRWAKAHYIEAYKLTGNDEIDKLEDIFPKTSGIEKSINYAIPELGIKECYYDPNGKIRSYRSRWQPLPLLNGGNVVLMTGICH